MRLFSLITVCAGLSFLGGSVTAAPVSIPLTITVTPPTLQPIPVQVSQSITIAGQQYLLTGLLTATPVVTTGWVPQAGGNPLPAALASQPYGGTLPMLAGYKNTGKQWATHFLPGDTLFVEGRGFGNTTGLVTLNTVPLVVSEWFDDEIGVTLTTPLAPQPNGLVLDVRLPTGEHVTDQGPIIGSR